jgi:hypothetical protein
VTTAPNFEPQLAQRDEHVLAADRAVLERAVERHRAAADLDAGGVARQQRQGDADVFLVADQAFRVVHAEGQADQRGHRRQRDVALVEGQLDADHARAVPLAHADDAVIGDRRGVGARPRTGQAEAGHFAAVGQARQVVVLLFLRAVVHQQLGRTQRVGHADGGADHRGDRRQLLDDLVVAQRGEAQAAVFLRHDHAEELVLLDVVPQLRRQVGVDVGDLPVVDHLAQLFDRAVDERLLVRAQRGPGLVHQHVPVRLAREQLAFPTHRAGFQRHALGLRQRRQDLGVEAQQRLGDEGKADLRQQQRHRDQRGDDGRDDGGRRIRAEQPAGHQRGGGQRGPHRKSQAVIGGDGADQQKGNEGNGDAHDGAPGGAAMSI